MSHDPPRTAPGQSFEPPPRPAERQTGRANNRAPALEIIEPITWQGQPIPERRWLVAGLVPLGNVTLLSGDGGIGKSLLVQQLATACAVKAKWLDIPTMPCRALYITCEDDRDELHRRQADIVKHYGAELGDLEALQLSSRVCMENIVFEAVKFQERGKLTILYDQIRNAVRDFGSQLLILDTVADLYGANENYRALVRQFINALRKIALDADGAVVLTSHPSIAGMATGTGLSGSTGWNNSVRSRLFLTRPKNGGDDEEQADPDVRVLRGMKSNYGKAAGAIKLRWTDGVFIREGEPTGIDRIVADAKADRVFLELLAAGYERGEWVSSAANVSNFAPRRFAAHPQAAGVGKKAFQAAMERMLHAGRIKAETYGRPSEPRFRLALQ
jgi:RecA-family ATPase